MSSWSNDNTEEHQRLRELLGSYALDHLQDAERSMVRAHLDGCPACRADLAEIAPLTGLLDLVDARHFDVPVVPPPDLGALIRSQVADERSTRDSDELDARRESSRRRTTTRVALGAAAAVVALAMLVGGIAVGRGTAPETAAPTPVPTVTLEPVDLTIEEPSIEIETSGLVAHTWGLELRMTGWGFDAGEVFNAAFRDSETGELVTAGAFIGTGDNPMTCNLQSALMRAQATELVVTDESGDVVMTAPL